MNIKHDLIVSEKEMLRFNSGDQTFHIVENSRLDIQAGDTVHFSTQAKNARVQSLAAAVTMVSSRNQAPNWVVFGFRLIRSDEAQIGWGMTNRATQQPAFMPIHEIQGYASEDDYNRALEIENDIRRNKQGKPSTAKTKRIAELEEELFEIDQRRKGKK